MSIRVRAPEDKDFFNWLGVYADYAELRDTSLTDEKALLVWSWFSDAAHSENALLAVDDDNNVVGLAHFHEYVTPIAGSRNLMLDDVFVDQQARGQGAGKALVDAVRAYAAEHSLANIRWMSQDEDENPGAFYGGEPAKSQWMVYDLAV